ncbi:MAG: hypothetical protein LBE24_01770 [Methylobacillus sp.]|jgi:hypothetical protein|nr:hypothetical protein [Methylobacillus sp.]
MPADSSQPQSVASTAGLLIGFFSGAVIILMFLFLPMGLIWVALCGITIMNLYNAAWGKPLFAR